MGVYGLTSYLRENARILSSSVQLSKPSEPVPFVVDGWSLIYQLQLHPDLPWVYGGEYDAFANLVTHLVRAWSAVGLQLHVVFDGPYLWSKFQTAASRVEQNVIQHALLFFRTSPASRSSPRFLHETRIIPPLCYSACIHALHAAAEAGIDVRVYHADEEGDPYAVELAARLGAYVCGLDSDFVILNAPGYAGYVPMDELVWTGPPSEEPTPTVDSDSGFKPVLTSSKSKRRLNSTARVSGHGLFAPNPIPPTDLTLSFSVYTPERLAAHLKLPVSLLPLLAALAGNDYSQSQGASLNSSRHPQHLFFQRGLTPVLRIARVASTLHDLIHPAANGPNSKRKAPKLQGAMSIVESAVDALLLRDPSSMGSGERDELVDRVAEATLPYALPQAQHALSVWEFDTCPLHVPGTCLLEETLLGSRASDAEDEHASIRAQLRARYMRAYQMGKLSPRLIDIMHTGTSWPRGPLENSDYESVTRSIGRPIRMWCYALMDDALGLPRANAPVDQSETETASEDSPHDAEDELIDVVEELSDDDIITPEDDGAESGDAGLASLAQLRGALAGLQSADSAPHSERSISQVQRPAIITEYTRRGTRVTAENLHIPSLRSLMGRFDDLNSPSHLEDVIQGSAPIVSLSDDLRFRVLLKALESHQTSVADLHGAQLTVTLALRWTIHQLHVRAVDAGSKERAQERWTRQEARAFLHAFTWTEESQNSISSDSEGVPTAPLGTAERPDILNRSVQLTAQASVALESVEHLAQILFLSDRVPSVAHRMSGSRFHSALTRPTPTTDVPEALWKACTDGLDDAFGADVGNRGKKGKRIPLPPADVGRGVGRAAGSNGMFSILTGMDDG